MSAAETGTESSDASGTEKKVESSNGKAKPTSSVTELELQFAQNPESNAYVDLCEAYLDQGRFMEAMVVCKKGIKAHPDAVGAKILLATVYARQKKYKRALTELDQLADKRADEASVFLARGRVRAESGDDNGAIEDLKRALDLDPSLTEASEILATKGVVYPEPEPAPAPPPPLPARPGMQARPASNPSAPPLPASGPQQVMDTSDLSGPGPAVAAAPSAPPQVTVRGVTAQERAASFGRIDPNLRYAPQRLEGEDELEELARKVADDTKEDRGKPKTTLVLLAALVVVGLITVVSVVLNKRKVEAIDDLTHTSFRAFNRDTYGSYKKTAADLEEIIEEWDDDHPLTLGRLAHTYAILWGEHGDSDLEPRLKEILDRAKKKASKVSHTIAASALYTLYAGEDRQASAKAAFEQVDPVVRKLEEEGAPPTHADLALGIVELQLGDYDAATRRLSRVSQVLPGSVRAKVWHARAAIRAKRLGTAQAAFEAALRGEPGHPGAMAGLALVKLERGNLRGAGDDLVKFDKFAEKHQKEISRPDAALAEFARSEIFRSAGEEEKAIGAYEMAIRLDPKNADFPFGLGRWLLENARPKEALVPLKKAVSMESTRWTFLVELASAEMRTGKYRNAEKHIAEALRLAPDRAEVLLAKARLLRRKDDPGAEKFIKNLLEKKSSAKTLVLVELGRLQRAQKRYDEAQKAYEEAIESMGGYPPATQGEILVSYGRLMDDMGQPGYAANAFEQAAKMGDLEGWYRLAFALAKGGREDRAKALKACERVLAAGASRYKKSAEALCNSLK